MGHALTKDFTVQGQDSRSFICVLCALGDFEPPFPCERSFGILTFSHFKKADNAARVIIYR
jgi:hypothetical protein